MMTSLSKKWLPGFLITSCASGCFTNPTPSAFNYPAILSDSSGNSVELIGAQISPTDVGILTLQGQMSPADKIMTIAGLSGQYDSASRTLALEEGGQITFPNDGHRYSTVFLAAPVNEASFSGVIGVPTRDGDLPVAGNSYYVGSSQVLVQSNSDVYDLNGSAELTIRFADSRGTFGLSGLSGPKYSSGTFVGISHDVLVIETGLIEVSGSEFTSNDLSITSSQIAPLLGGAVTSELRGNILGPGADEVAGVFMIAGEQGSSEFVIAGTFLAD